MSSIETIFYSRSRTSSVTEGKSFEKLFELYDHLTDTEKENLRKSSKDILSKCVPALNQKNYSSNVGLVIGKIQSGKTTSFTSLLALARDNGYKIAIIIAGRTNLLLKQTSDRLNKDLNQNDINISVNNNAYERDLGEYLFKKLDRSQKTSKLFIIPVLKHQDHLRKIKEHLENPFLKDKLKNNSILIIDDEADQASLNTYARSNAVKEEDNASAIYSSIKNLRDSIPSHSFIQYTATPQANLLLDTFSLLSPDWHVVLKAGSSYTGGNEFFTSKQTLVRNIKPEGSYPESFDELGSTPPQSLCDSICEYLILASLMAGVGNNKSYNQKATMLIHPSWRVNESNKGEVGIKRFYNWTRLIIERLDHELRDRFYDSFFNVYEKIKIDFKNDPELIFPSLNDICDFIYENILDDLAYSIRLVIGESKDIKEGYPWDSNNYHILVGGTLLDRGFTVENLIMTYMPRDSKGKNQADTIEQRCRFYGYRKKYLKFCRVYITSSLKDDFESYNEYENYITSYLEDNTLTSFFNSDHLQLLDSRLNPTNRSRVAKNLKRIKFEDSKIWFEPQPYSMHHNNNLIENIINSNELKWGLYKPASQSHTKNKNLTHKIAKVEANLIFDLFKKLKTDNPFDSSKLYNLICHLDYKLKDIKDGWIVQIAPDYDRVRSVNKRMNRSDALKISALRFGGIETHDGEVIYKDIDVLINPNWGADIEVNYKNEIVVYIYKFKSKSKTDSISKGQYFYVPNIYFPKSLSSQYLQAVEINENK